MAEGVGANLRVRPGRQLHHPQECGGCGGGADTQVRPYGVHSRWVIKKCVGPFIRMKGPTCTGPRYRVTDFNNHQSTERI